MTIDEFQKIELRVGKVLTAERVEGSEKLLRLEVALGGETRQIVAGIQKMYVAEDMPGREIVVVANLEPRKFTLQSASEQIELESQGMLLAAQDEKGNPVLIMPEREVPPGSLIR